MNRRTFVQLWTLAAMGCAHASEPRQLPPGPKKLLLLGGTRFLGPHLVEAALARGHTVTLFNRGKTNPHLFPELEKLRGDRDGDLRALEGRSWDAVIDTSGMVPRVVRASAELLAPRVKRYVFVSSISAYADKSEVGLDETSPLERLWTDSEDERHYGALKAGCEHVVDQTFGHRHVILRPTVIVGPGDPSDRLTYWVARALAGGEILAPGSGDDPVQLIDARDLAAWTIALVDGSVVGTFNAVGPARRLTMRELLAACAGPRHVELTWVGASYLRDEGVAEWCELPLWVSPSGSGRGFTSIRNDRALASGLAIRPLAQTVKDTAAWFASLPEARRANLVAGLDAAREQALLAGWRSRSTNPR